MTTVLNSTKREARNANDDDYTFVVQSAKGANIKNVDNDTVALSLNLSDYVIKATGAGVVITRDLTGLTGDALKEAKQFKVVITLQKANEKKGVDAGELKLVFADGAIDLTRDANKILVGDTGEALSRKASEAKAAAAENNSPLLETLDESTTAAGEQAPTYTLQAALAKGSELEAVYKLSDANLAIGADKTVAEVLAAKAAAQALISGAYQAEGLQLAVTYALVDTLANLQAADAAVLEGAASYSLSETEFTAEGVESDVAGLAADQEAAVAAVLANEVLAGAANAADVTVANGAYTLVDTLANLQAADAAVLEGAASYSLSETEFTAEGVESDVAGLAAAQEAAVAAVLANEVLAGAANAADVTVANGAYTLVDAAAALLDAANAEVVAAAATVKLDAETVSRADLEALRQLGNVELGDVVVENSAPVAEVATASAIEDGAVVTGQLNATDVDVSDAEDNLEDALTYALVGDAPVGFTLNADGSYSFDAAQEAFQALQAGDTQDVVINYTVTDSKGATSTSTLTLTVTGTDDAPVVAIAEGTENALLTGAVFGAEDSISDVDGFGEGATVTLAYGEAVVSDYQYGTPQFAAADEFRVARDGNTFTLIAEGGENGFEADTAIGTVTPVGLQEVLDEDGQGTGDYTQTGYTLELNDNVSPAVLTALLKQLSVQGAADGSNTQLTVTIASQGGAESVEFVRNVEGENGGGVTLTKAATDPLEAELTAGALNTQSADVPFAAFGTLDLDVDDNALINGMTVELSSTNQADKFALAADSAFEIINGQLILKAEARVVAEVSGIGSNSVVVTFASDAGLIECQVENELIEKLLLDLEDAIGQRTVNLNVTSGDGLSEASLSRDISVLGEFTAVTLAQIEAADATDEPSTAITIDGNTILNVDGFDDALDIQAQIDAGNLIIEGANPIRVIVGTDANLSEVEGLELLGDLRIQSVADGSTLTLNATQVDFLSTAGEVEGAIAVLALEDNLDADLSVLEAGDGVTAAISAAAGNVTFTGDFGTAVVTVGADSTLTATAAVLSEVTVTGNVVVTGLDGAAAYDLAGLNAATAVLAAGVTTLNEETDLGTVKITVPQNSELVLTADQANGTAIAGGDVNGTGNKGGSVTVLGLVDCVDLRDITVSKVLAGAVNATQSDLIVTFRAEDEEAEEGVIAGIKLGNFSVQVEAGATLRIDEAANGAIITGAGNVEVHVDNAGALDLSDITVDGAKTVEVLETVDLSSEAVDFGDFAVNVAANATLTLSSSQADQLTVTGESVEVADVQGFAMQMADQGGSVVIELDGNAAYDFSGITAGAESAEEANDAGTVTATVATTTVLNAETKLGAITRITIDTTEGADLTLSAAQASGLTVAGTGNVDGENTVVTVNDLTADTDLSGIVTGDTGIDEVIANVSGAVDISANANLDSVTEFRVANDATLTLSARQANLQAVKVAKAVPENEQTGEIEAQAAGAVVIAGPVALEGEEAGLALDFSSVEAFTFQGGSLVIGEGVSLTLSAAQASGKVITGAGSVEVTGLQAGTDLSGITVEGTKTATVTGDLILGSTADLGDFAVEVTPGHTLTLTAAQAAALVTLEGAGSAIINGTAAADTLDFSAKTGWTVDTLTINGAGGADTLEGPANFVGELILNGGTNADTFVVATDATIGDFAAGVDELLIGSGVEATITLGNVFNFSATEVAALIDNQGTLIIEGYGESLAEANQALTGSVGNDVLAIEGTVDLSGSVLTSIEALNVADGATVTISEAQLAAFVITKGGNASVVVAADDDNVVALVGTDGVVDSIDNLVEGDTIDFSALTGTTLFVAASDTEAGVDYVIGHANKLFGESSDVSADEVNEEGEWAFNTDSGELTYFNGMQAQTITLIGVENVSADGSGVLAVSAWV